MDDTKVAFTPFASLNNFMRPDYRLTVIRSALQALPTLPESLRNPVDEMTRKVVRVPGFRHGDKAPTLLKVVPISKAFEKSSELVAAVIAAWAEAHADLRQKVYDLLKARNWELLPVDADRTKLPGFLPKWPKGEDYETLYKAFTEMYPDVVESIDNVSLMVVWLSTRLPYQLVEPAQKETPPTEDKQPAD